MDASRQTWFAEFAAEAMRDLSRHQLVQRCFRDMATVADQSTGDADAARLLLETLGSEQEVKKWCEQQIDLTRNVLLRWYMTARLEVHENNRTKEISQ